MNLWKPLALVSMSSFVLMVGYQAAHANPSPKPEPATLQGAQPNMQAALASLQAAKDALQKAEHDKGGWRTAAIGKVDGAIADTKRGIAYADSH